MKSARESLWCQLKPMLSLKLYKLITQSKRSLNKRVKKKKSLWNLQEKEWRSLNLKIGLKPKEVTSRWLRQIKGNPKTLRTERKEYLLLAKSEQSYVRNFLNLQSILVNWMTAKLCQFGSRVLRKMLILTKQDKKLTWFWLRKMQLI